MSQQEKRNKQFLKAARNGEVGSFQKLLSHGGFSSWSGDEIPPADIHALDKNGNNAVVLASVSGSADAVERIVALGVDKHLTNNQGATALMFAQNEKTVELLIQGASEDYINKQDREAKTALLHAIKDRKWQVGYSLLGAGADPNIADNIMATPLMYAAARGDAPMVKSLLEAGADVHLRNNEGRTAWFYVCNSNSTSVEVCALLVLAGIDTTIKDKAGSVPGSHYLRHARDFIKTKQPELNLPNSSKPLVAAKPAATKSKRKTAISANSELQDAFIKNGLDPDKGEHWIAMGESVVENVVGMTSSPNVLSTIFNFESGQTITQRRNLLTGQESTPIVQSMYDYPRQGYVFRAHRQLQDMGKNPPAYEVAIEAINKPRLQPKN